PERDQRMKNQSTILLDILYSALHEEYGIKVATEDAERLRQQLYAARRKAGDPDLENLSISISPLSPQTELWVINKKGTTND
ncbi:hypothetical protein D6827_01650, partial [Candidatus Parcubacteria bacterium]